MSLDPVHEQPQAPVGRGGEEEPSAGCEHSPHLGQPAGGVSDVLDHLAGPDQIESAVREGQGPVEGNQLEAELRMSGPRPPQGGLGHVCADHRLRAGLRRQRRERALPAAQVEHPVRRLQAREQKPATPVQIRRRQLLGEPLP